MELQVSRTAADVQERCKADTPSATCHFVQPGHMGTRSNPGWCLPNSQVSNRRSALMFPHRARIFAVESIERAGMARAPGQRWTARLLAAVASLALVLASLLGSAAHACETSHHGQHRHQSHAGQQHAHHHGAAAKGHSDHGTDRVVAAPDKASGAASALDHPEPGGSDRSHTCCMDFICHGCIAVIAGDAGAQLVTWHEARVLPWDGQALASVSPARLDRPPKALVSA